MRRLYRKVLRVLKAYLSQNLLVRNEIIDHLYADEAIDINEKEVLEYQKCNRDKVNELISILSPKSDIKYQIFKETLKRTANKEVLEELEEKEKILEKESNEYDRETSTLLKKLFQEVDTEKYTRVTAVQDLILNDIEFRRNTGFLDDVLYDENFLAEVMKSTFPAVVQTSRKQRKKKECQVFYGIVPLNPTSHSVRERQESESSQSSEFEMPENDKTVESPRQASCSSEVLPSCEEFYLWIKDILHKHCQNASAAEQFKTDAIDGSVFDDLTDEELKVYLPVFGQRKKVKKEFEKLKKSKAAAVHEYVTSYDHNEIQILREFDTEARYGESYKVGNQVTQFERRRGNLLVPVHKFKQISSDKSVTEVSNMIAEEVLGFGSACMNERVNGTIHFGIEPMQNGTYAIRGIVMSSKQVERTITESIRSNFFDGEVATALGCIRPAQFIEVTGYKSNQKAHFVIEIDIVPSTKVIESKAYFLKPKHPVEYECIMFRLFGNETMKINPKEIQDFMHKEKDKLFDDRQDLESNKRQPLDDKNKILKDFLCCGSKYLEQSIFPILVLGDDCKSTDNLNFLQFVKWRAIFDLSSTSNDLSFQAHCEQAYKMVFNTNYVEDFDSKQSGEKNVKEIKENLKCTSLPNWIYCNKSKGDTTFSEPSEWKIGKLDSFQKALEFYLEQCPPGRERVLVPFFGSQDKILLEATGEIFRKCQTNCLVLSQYESTSSSVKAFLQRRDIFPSKTDIESLFLHDIPWVQVAEAMEHFCTSSERKQDTRIPRSTGVPYALSTQEIRELCDLEVLPMNQSEIYECLNETEMEIESRKSKEEFFRGGMVSWMDLYCSDNVLVREVHTELSTYVWGALSNARKPITPIMIYHQPGAGGSTCARQILWDCRNKYRCCIVNATTKQTCEQINLFRIYGEENETKAEPIIILIDLDEDETIGKFIDDINAEGEKHSTERFAVLVICTRRSEVPTNRKKDYVFLEHTLNDREKNWFKKTHKKLVKNHEIEKGCDPDTLFSFNIMKENFDPDAIKKQITRFVRDPKLTQDHHNLLKYVSLLNCYDLNFQEIPMDCFTPLLINPEWASHIPKAFRLMVNITSHKLGVSGRMTNLRIKNSRMSLPVLNAELEYERDLGQTSCSPGEIMIELLNSKIIPEYSVAEYSKKLEKILGNIIKKRGLATSGEKLKQFCPLVTYLIERGDIEPAISIVKRVKEITDDPMVAQQLARLYAEYNRWDEACATIVEAIKQMQDNSYLYHTGGQIFMLKFDNFIKKLDGGKDDDDIIYDAFGIAAESFRYFTDSQRVSRLENILPQNPAGFDGEIKLGIDILKNFDHKTLFDICSRKSHKRINDGVKECLCKYLKRLPERIYIAFEVLEADIHLQQIENEPVASASEHFLTILANGTLQTNKDEFERLLYGSINMEKDQTEDVRSFVDAKRASTPVLHKVITKFVDGNDNNKELRSFMASALEVMLRGEQVNVAADCLLRLSRQFCNKSDRNASIFCRLEAHFALTILHWPLPEKKPLSLCPISIFTETLKSWHNLVKDKPHKPRNADKIICYLPNGRIFLIAAEQATEENLFVFVGSVCTGGKEVEIKHSLHTSIKISLSRTQLSSKWNRPAKLVIGFGICGPKAVIIDQGFFPMREVNIKTRKERPNTHFQTAHQSRSARPNRSQMSNRQHLPLSPEPVFPPLPSMPYMEPNIYFPPYMVHPMMTRPPRPSRRGNGRNQYS